MSQLARVLEPEAMDTPEEAREYDAMDHAEVNRIFVCDLIAAAGDLLQPQVEVLDLGTGTAQIPIELCRQHDAPRVTGIDLAISMLDVAMMNVDVAGLRSRILLSHVDAKGLPFEPEHFSIVMSNSIVHHIPEPRRAIREAIRVTKPDGLLFIRDLLRPQTDEQVQAFVDLYAKESGAHQRAMFDASLRAALSLEEIRAIVSELGFSPQSVQPTSDRHWTWSARVE